ncbi:hypothetical protein HY490_00975 [Candidatus Woesearchaeota archaeon]|nr:hypothetical protein [Candidatus Woesearchaeota archaeon]
MLVRKLVQSGPSSFTIALPRTWIRAQHLKKGDLVEVDAQPDHVLVRRPTSAGERVEQEVTINVDGKDMRTLQRDIRAAYISADRIVLIGKTLADNIYQLKKDIAEMVALEIVDESPKSIVCKNFVNMQDVNVPNLIRRIDNIVRSMLMEVPLCLDNPHLAPQITERDVSVNRLGFLMLKCMKTALQDYRVLEFLKLAPIDIVMYWDLNVHIEKIGDEAKRMARLLAALHKKKGDQKKLIELLKASTTCYQEAMKSVYTKDIELSDSIAIRRPQLVKECDEYFEQHNDVAVSEITGKIKGMLSHITDISRLVRYLTPIQTHNPSTR